MDVVAALRARYRPATERASEAHMPSRGWSVLGPHGIGNRRFGWTRTVMTGTASCSSKRLRGQELG
jgi:hypothetical protein